MKTYENTAETTIAILQLLEEKGVQLNSRRLHKIAPHFISEIENTDDPYRTTIEYAITGWDEENIDNILKEHNIDDGIRVVYIDNEEDIRIIEENIRISFLNSGGMELDYSTLKTVYKNIKNKEIRRIAEKYDFFGEFKMLYELVYNLGYELFENVKDIFDETEAEVLEWLLTEQHTEQYWELAGKAHEDNNNYYKILKQVEEMELPASMALELIDTETL